MQGCAESVLRPQIRAASVRVLNRAGFDVEFAENEGCCGALVLHLGREQEGLDAVRRNVDAWSGEIAAGLDAIVVTSSGCGTTVKDYGFMLRNDPAYAEKAAMVSNMAKDVSELLDPANLPPERREGSGLLVAYQSPCSMQHGQRLDGKPRRLLEAAGFSVIVPAESHMCCGSAGVYNILQPQIAGHLGDRKAAHLERLGPDVIATGNIGCAVQIGARTTIPIVHTVELIDWAGGGPRPDILAGVRSQTKATCAPLTLISRLSSLHRPARRSPSSEQRPGRLGRQRRP